MWPMLISLCLALSGKPPRKAAPRRRPAFRRPLLEALEDRTLLSGVGAIGDSYTVPYFNRFGPNTHNWVEALADLRGVPFGGPASQPDQRGYANVWWGPNSYGGTQVAAPGLAAEISAGQVSLAADEVGTHDFIWYPIPNSAPWELTPPRITLSPSVSGTVFSDIYNGTLAGASLQSYTNQVLGNLGQILDTLSAAGGARVVAFNIGDFSKAPAISQLGFTNPAGLARYSSAVAAADSQYEALAAQKGIPLLDQPFQGESFPLLLALGE
jgi:hypothetical protein